MRSLTWLSLLLVVGCASRQDGATGAGDRPEQRWQQRRDEPARPPAVTFDQQQALKNLKAQAEEVGKAAVGEDHARLAELTHPALLEKFGGRAAYVRKLESIAAELKGQGFRLRKVTVGEPSPLVQAAGALYAVVPSEGELSGPAGAVGRQPSYLIAVSQDGGAGWTFIDGAGVGGDRAKLKRLLPDFPDQLRLPAAQPPVWSKE